MSDFKKEKVLDDEKIVGLFWKRSESAISETDRKYGKYLFVIANNILNDNYDSEECVNDTYFGVWEAIPPARPKKFPGFISKITRNLAVGVFRKRLAQKRIPTEMIISLEELEASFEPAVDGEALVDARELGRLISEYLGSLSARDEYIFVCRYYYCDKVQDIASSLGLSSVTVREHLKKMRDGLVEYLKNGGFSV